LATTLGVWALVAGSIAGAVAGTALSYIVAPYRPRLVFRQIEAESLFRFGRWIFLGGLVGVMGDAALRVVISRELGADELGRYFLAAGLALLPNQVVSGLISSVAFPLHAQVQYDPARRALVYRASVIGMSLILIPTYLVLIVLAPSLVQHVLGPNWGGTETAIQLLSVAGILGIAFDAAAPMFEGRGEPQKSLVMQLAVTVTVIILAALLTDRLGLFGAALAWTIAQFVMVIVAMFLVSPLVSNRTPGMAAQLFGLTLLSVVAALVAAGIDYVLPGIPGFVVALLVSAAVVIGLIIVGDKRFGLRLTQDFAQAFPALAARFRLHT
jgi:lipopolysaccharide exporter